MQAGLGVGPGAGAHVAVIQSRSIYTLEVLAAADSELWKERTPLYISMGVGVALRPVGVLRIITGAEYEYDLDLGVRFGPTLSFLQKPSRTEKNRQFNLFLDPFLRYIRSFGQQKAYFEVGPQRPIIRVGLWIPL